jgi:hypothetical protein
LRWQFKQARTFVFGFLYSRVAWNILFPSLGVRLTTEEKTIVLRGERITNNALLALVANTKTKMDVCADSLAPSIFNWSSTLKQAMLK